MRHAFRLSVAGMLVVLLAALIGVPVVTAKGDCVGVVVNFSRSGILSDTWEGQADLGMTGGKDRFWYFTVRDDGPVREIADALKSGSRVRMTYEEQPLAGVFRSKSSRFVVGVSSSPR